MKQLSLEDINLDMIPIKGEQPEARLRCIYSESVKIFETVENAVNDIISGRRK